ncbi:uncharacterized protein LOC141607912 [Silene latifolia]|uniref:uncharacterized protein LOC141607912 n=1 Tax=Silene latifolia TaxID=37657 RepID=UPI003D787E37
MGKATLGDEGSIRKNSGFSWGSRSILHGLNLIQKHMGWKPGCSSKLNVRTSKWVEGEYAKAGNDNLSIDMVNIRNLNARDLFIEGEVEDRGGWNEDMVRGLFSEETASKILAMPVNLSRREDFIFWPHSSTGEYNVKSGYGIVFTNFMEFHGSEKDRSRVGCEEKNFCRSKLWKLPGPATWKLLIWRIITNTLPVGINFEKRNIPDETGCKLCDNEGMVTETMKHLFRECEISKRFWACNDLGIRVTHDRLIDIRKWIFHWVNYMSKLEDANVLLLRFMATLWCLWCVRNKILFKKEKFHPSTLLSTWVLEVGKADEALVEFNKDREIRSRNMSEMEDERRRWLRESKPFYAVGSNYNCECIRVMVDAGWKTREKASIGWVAYTETGQKIIEKCMAI